MHRRRADARANFSPPAEFHSRRQGAEFSCNFRRLAMNGWVKIGLCASMALGAASASGVCSAQTYNNGEIGSANSPSSQNWQNSSQNWRNNPNNWQNSTQNWQNSSQNWQNSQQNWQNSGNNYNNANGIYDQNGNRTGYVVPGPNGAQNYFDNNGNRTGYQPGGN
jgi:hypothetical protein